MQRTCPECGRTLNTRIGKFEIEVWPRHKMATAWTKSGMPSEATGKDFAPGANYSAAMTHEIDCPNSGQPVQD